ncbi:MAG: glycosyltransferase family 2 protein [Spirochaetaceae bacterium]|nr:glycosyltransferase family 2 protein [Spirochaetaceae bacterium]
MLLSYIVPCHNEEESLPLFYTEANKAAQQLKLKYNLEAEFIFVDDGSSDKTLNLIKNFKIDNGRVRYLSFSRNFGKEAAIYAGLRAAKGDYLTLLDADLQDPPNLLTEMYAEVLSGNYDCVATRRATRKGEPPIRSWFARRFYSLINKISSTKLVDGARDFRLFNRKMADAIIGLGEYNRFSKGIFSWVGFKTKWLSYDNIERAAGNSKWNFNKLFAYSLEGIFAFSSAPLAIASFLGLFFCALAFVFIAVIIARTLIWGDPVAGYPSLITAILFIGGLQLFCLGIIGQYLARLYLESKKRPIYIIKEEG